jgi:type IV pilus assembly protein PilQ
MTVSLFVPFGAYATSMVMQNETTEVAEPTNGTRSKFITDISTSEDNDSISVTITCNTFLNYMSVKQQLPLGLALDFPETSLEVAKTEYDIDNAIIGTIKASELVEKGRSRITIFLKKDLPYQISREGDVVRVVFARGAETETAESMQSEPPIENNLINIIPETLDDKFKIVVHTNRRIEDVKTITLTDPPRIVLDLYGVKSSRKGQQTKMQVKSRWITNVRYFAYPEKVRVVLDTKTEFLTAFTIESLDDGLIVLVGSDIKTP